MPRLDRTVTRKTSLHHDQDADDVAYWLTRTPEERLEALEYLRRQAYAFYFLAYGSSQPANPGIQRVCRVVKRERG